MPHGPHSTLPQRPQSARAATQTISRVQRIRPQSAGTTYQANAASNSADGQVEGRWTDTWKGGRGGEHPEDAALAPVATVLQAAADFDPGGYKEQLLQAAIMQVAPNSHMSSCRYGACCWRWAARRLMDECALAQKTARLLRTAFYEELGDSVRQQLIHMQQDYADLQAKMHAAREQLEVQSQSMAALERKLEVEVAARLRAEIAQERAECAQQEVKKKAAEMANHVWALQGQLLELKAPKETIERMEKRCKELEEFAEDADRARRKALEELAEERDMRRDLEYKNTQLNALEQDRLKARQRIRKGTTRKDALRPALPLKK